MNKKNKPTIEEFSEEKKNVELVVADNGAISEALLEKAENEAIKLAKEKLVGRKDGDVVIETMNVIVRPFREQLKNRHERFYKNSKFHLAADIVFIAVILGLATMALTFLNFQPKAQIDLQAVLADDSAASGQVETFIVQYKNNGKIDIKNAALSFSFPKNFVLLSISPENDWSDQTNTLKIGDLPRGANGKIKISGIVYGQVGSSETLAYSLKYLQNGWQGSNLGSYIFPLESSALSVSYETPKTIYRGVDFGGKITLKNNGQANIDQEIDLNFADTTLVLKSISSDTAVLSNGEIIVSGLKAGEEQSFEYQAATEAPEGSLNSKIIVNLNLAGQKIKQAQAVRSLSVAALKFGVDISADKSVIKSEEAVNFKLNFSNLENSDIKNAVINISSADSAVELKSFVLKNSLEKYKVSGNSISLGDLKAGEVGEIDFEALLSRNSITVNQQAGIAAEISYQIDGRTAAYKTFSPKIKFISDLAAGSKALYYSAQGDQLGVGPLPPVVDVPTKYWIFWEINNSGNKLKDFVMTADLPANVGWTNQQTVLAGDLRFGEVSNKVVWTVADVSEVNGNYRAGFEVELVPRNSDLGLVPEILTNIKYVATDSFTGTEISGALPSLTTDLKDDPTASGKGRVIEIKIVK